jgi:hypothetical protein
MKATFSCFVFAFANLAPSASADDVAIRMLVNSGRKAGSHGGSCTRPEVNIIKNALVTAVRGSRPHLRKSGSNEYPSYCSDYCEGFEPGTCWLVDSACATDASRRRDEEVKGGTILSKVEMILPVIFDADRGDFTSKQYATCQAARQSIIQEMEQGLDANSSLTNSCKQMLRQKINLTCVKVPESSAVLR